MKAKTIKQHLRQKIDEWIFSVEDATVQEILRKNVIVTGGCIASMLLREKVNDYDVYLKSREACLAVAKYYISRFHPKTASGIKCAISVDDTQDDRVSIIVKSAGIASENGTEKPYEYFEARAGDDPAAGAYVSDIMQDAADIFDVTEQIDAYVQEDNALPRYRPVFISTNAITLSNRIQIITRFYGEPDEIHSNYDFVHCTNYWKSWDNDLVLRQSALEALLTKELRYVGSKYPVCSIIRLRKFIARGWSVNAGQILKMVMQASELDLTNPNVLRDQLTGVDAAYFCEVLAKLKEKDPVKINAAYLIEIIDRMF